MNIRAALFRSEPSMDLTLVHNEERLAEELAASARPGRLIQQTDSNGMTYLHHAAKNGALGSVGVLLQAGADPNVSSGKLSGEMTAVHFAAKYQQHSVLRQLLEYPKSNLYRRDLMGKTPLDYAIRSLDSALEAKLGEIWRQKMQEQKLDMAVAEDSLRTGQPLTIWRENLAVGSKVKVQGADGAALELRSEMVFNSLPLARALPSAYEVPAILSDCTALHLACQFGCHRVVKHLLGKAPKLLNLASMEGYTPLHILAMYNQVEVLQLVIDLAKRQEAQCQTPSPAPTDVTADTNHSERTAICKPAFSASTETGHTPLHLAAILGHAEFVQVLVANASSMEVPLNQADCLHLTPLHSAIACMPADNNTAWCSVVECLLKGGAKADSHIHRPDNVHMYATPLAQACAGGHFDQVHQLLHFGAKDAKRDALNLCLQQDNSPVLVQLLSRLISYEAGRYSILWQYSAFPGVINPSWMADALICNWIRMTQPESAQISIGMAFQLENAVTKVDLSNCGLRRLPIEVFQFPNMEVLAADSNELTSLPLVTSPIATATDEPQWDPPLAQSGWACLNLQRLTLKKNNLTHLPQCLFQLPLLATLEVSYNQLTTLPDNVWIAPKLQQCSCSNNLLASLPSNQSLYLNQTVITSQNSEVAQVRSASRSSFFVVDSTTYPVQAAKERQLNISESQSYLDTTISSSWGTDGQGQPRQSPLSSRSPPAGVQDRLVQLHPSLVFEDSQQEARSSECLGILRLLLANNRLMHLPPDLPCLCPNLEKLDLSGNQLSFVNLPYGLPRTLSSLMLNGNKLTDLSCCKVTPELHFCTMPHGVEQPSEEEARAPAGLYYCHTHSSSKLHRLTSLWVRSCDLAHLDLCCPQEADLADHTHSHSGSQEAAGGVRKRDKSASEGSESQLTSADVMCPVLRDLYLSGNRLQEVPASVLSLTHLVSLHLSHNSGIIHLPRELGGLRKLREVHVEGLSLIFPPMELLGRNSVSHDIVTYLQFLYQQNRPYQCIKLMVVGRESRGKTTLLRRLMERGQQTEDRSLFSRRHNSGRTQLTTVGISLRDWVYRRSSNVIADIRTITYRTWDFAGQGDFYSTHQIFLSGTAVFLAVWNVTHRRRGAAELEKWLRNIHARVAHPAVIIVGTHYDLLSSREDHEYLAIQLRELADKYRIPPYSPGVLQTWKELPADGFPPVMASVVVSSTTGKDIPLLRDIIYEVSCSLKGGDTGGTGALPGATNVNRSRYVLSQFHPASFLWLEDLVRSLTADYRQRRAPPVLTSREFKEAVFSNRGNMFLGNTAERDLGQAVKFLCANGTLFHQEDPVLADLYFIDLQWLVDLFAHVVTIENINFRVSRDTGVMQKCHLDDVFQHKDEFPMCWKKEYIRLMTLFEVIVEIDAEQILIPSRLPSKVMSDPFLMGSESMSCLPPLHHLFVMPYIPSGFWTRLIARVLGDTSLVDAATACFRLKTPVVKSFFDTGQPFFWDLAQEGLMLKYGPHPVLTIREIPQGRLFQASSCSKVHHLLEGSLKWESTSNQDHHGLQVVVNDLFPLVALEEAAEVHRHFGFEGLSLLPFVQFDSSRPLETSIMSYLGMSVSVAEGAEEGEGPDTPTGSLRLPSLPYLNGQEVITNVTAVKRGYTPDNTSSDTSSTMGRAATVSGSDELPPYPRPRSRVLSSPPLSRHSFLVKRTERGQSSPTLGARSTHQPASAPKPPWEEPTADTLRTLEEHYDTHRAAILSHILEHIRSVLEHWYPRLLGPTASEVDAECIPCPFCWSDLAHVQQCFRRSFSACKDLQDGVRLLVRPSAECVLQSPPFTPPLDERPDAMGLSPCIVGLSPPSWESHNFYLFKFKHLLDNTAESLQVFCPNHHTFPAKYIAPDLVFQSLGPAMVIPDSQLEEVSVLGQGHFATVHRMKWHHQDGHRMLHNEVALKKMKYTQESRAAQHLALEKELTLLTSLAHPNVLQCLGVVLHPLGAVLELAAHGSLRAMYLDYARVGQVIPACVIHKTLLDVTNGLEYLHCRGIIYQDLKCDNVLVWRYLLPGQQASYQDDHLLCDDAVLVKLADFNISAVIPTVNVINQPRGTLGHMAPELFNYKYGLYTNKVDIFSLGSVMYELVSFETPFESQGTPELMFRGRPPLHSKSRALPVLLLELMAWCWEDNAELRPSACQVLDALKMPQYLRLQTALDLHSKLYPTCLTVWRGEPCDQQEARPQPKTTEGPASLQESHTHSPDACQLWVACADFHTSSLIVWDFSDGHFTAVQDISGGASTVLCVPTVQDSVWVGFEHGFIMVYSARTKQPSLQLWPHGRCQSVQCMAYVPSLQTVYLGFQNGLLWAVPENVVAMETVGMVTRSLSTPKVTFQDYNKTIAAILPVTSSVSKGYELWVGQNQKTIAIIDASTLKPIKYLSCDHDNSSLPQYLSDSYVGHFALDKQLPWQLHTQERGNFLYSALFSGQVVTRWCPVAKQRKAIYNVTKCMGKECWITALHVSRRNVCVGLTNGKILILQSVGGAMLPLTTFSCHQQQVKCLTTLPPDHADGMDHHHGDEHSWQRAMPHPHPAHLLVSCGLGFHSYPSPSPSEQPSIPHPNALPPAKILTWDLAGLQ